MEHSIFISIERNTIKGIVALEIPSNMAAEIREITSTDKDLHLSYESGTQTHLSSDSNGKHSVEHREHLHAPPAHVPELLLEQHEYAWGRIRRFMQEPFSEFFGVFVMILFGDGVVAQVVLSSGTKGDYQSISWGWG